MRIIAKIDIKNDFVIKGIMYDGTRKICKLRELIGHFKNFKIEELILTNFVSSLYSYDEFMPTIQEQFKDVFLPTTISGGIKNEEFVDTLFKNGADKIALNSILFDDFNLVKIIIKKYGSQALSSCVQTKKIDGKWLVFKDVARHSTGIELKTWVKRLENSGFGEVNIINVDRDGTLKGLDFSLIDEIPLISIPVIISGGLNNYNDINILNKFENISGVGFSSLIYKDIRKNKL